MTARWHLDGGDDLDALQHCRDQRGRDPIIAEAALASDSQKPRGNQLAQVAARRRARDIRAVSSSVAVSDWPPIRALSIVARAVSPTRAATSTRFAAATILKSIAETGRYQTKTVRHRPNCSRETIAILAALMRCSRRTHHGNGGDNLQERPTLQLRVGGDQSRGSRTWPGTSSQRGHRRELCRYVPSSGYPTSDDRRRSAACPWFRRGWRNRGVGSWCHGVLRRRTSLHLPSPTRFLQSGAPIPGRQVDQGSKGPAIG